MASRGTTVAEVIEADLCLGCGACVSSQEGGMVLSQDGFLRPQGNLNFMATHVEAFCPGIFLGHPQELDVPYDPHWGPVQLLRTGHSTDPEVRLAGSSGGVLSAIAIDLLARGEVNGVLHTKANPDDPIGNVTTLSRTREEVIDGCGSRYGPSSPLEKLETHLASGERFAFVGKPCDIAALRRRALIDSRVERQIPYMLSFFCAGVPSRRGTEALLAALGVEVGDLALFRYRGEGWPGLARALRRDGSSATMDYNSSWGGILHTYLQFRCKICPDGTGEFADVVCGDAWYGKNGYPDFSDREGRSLVVARTLTGQRLIEDLAGRQAIAMEPLDVRELTMMQPYQANRKRSIAARLLGMKVVFRRTPTYRNLKLGRLALKQSQVQNIRNFVGAVLRACRAKR